MNYKSCLDFQETSPDPYLEDQDTPLDSEDVWLDELLKSLNERDFDDYGLCEVED